MEPYIVIAKKLSTGKYEDLRILKYDAATVIPTGFEKIVGPATLDDCVRYIKDSAGPNWFGLTVAQYLLIGVVTLTFVVVVVIGATKLYSLQPEKIAGPTTDDGARVFITFVIAVATVAIAFLAILSAMLLREYEKRFALAKEVLTILVGILGTIVGFYFGTAKITPGANTNTNSNTTAPSNGTPANNSNGNSNQTSPSTPTNGSPITKLLRRSSGQFVLVIAGPARESDRGPTVSRSQLPGAISEVNHV